MSHSIGESVVNSENMKMGNVIQIRENDGMVQVTYQAGVTEWVDAGQSDDGSSILPARFCWRTLCTDYTLTFL